MKEIISLLDHNKLYRLPWNMTDNAKGWLEITTKCNLHCQGCYREDTNKHKTIEEIKKDLNILSSYRKFDSLVIAGGEPLLHPKIIEIVNLVTQRGWKSEIFTNGSVAEETILRHLRDAGLTKLNFHIDSKQKRPAWEGKSELELNELRLKYAQMVAKVGRLRCGFIAMIHEDTLNYVPRLVEWAQKHINIVSDITFTCYRIGNLDNYDCYVKGEKLSDNKICYFQSNVKERDITAHEIIARIREVHPNFAPYAYLGGTEVPNSFKWLGAGYLGTSKRVYGYAGPKLVEIVQMFSHFIRGRYFSCSRLSKLGVWNWVSWMWLFDRGVRHALLKYLFDAKLFFKKLRFQAIGILQPNDTLPDGRINMCDGCPDMCVWNGRLVRSCRLDEYLKYGELIKLVPKEKT